MLLGVCSSILVEERRGGLCEDVQDRYGEDGAEEKAAKDGAVRHDGSRPKHEAAPGCIRTRSSDPVNDSGSKRCRQELGEGVCICER